MPDLRNDFADNSPMTGQHAAHHNALANAVNAPSSITLTSPDDTVWTVTVNDAGELVTTAEPPPAGPVTFTGMDPEAGSYTGGGTIHLYGTALDTVTAINIISQTDSSMPGGYVSMTSGWDVIDATHLAMILPSWPIPDPVTWYVNSNMAHGSANFTYGP